MAEVGSAPDTGGGGWTDPLFSRSAWGGGHRAQEGGGDDQEHAEMPSLEWFVP